MCSTTNSAVNTPPTGTDAVRVVAEDGSYVVTAADFGFADDEVQALSSGNQQRVQLAISLVHDPDLLVLDILMPEQDGLSVCRALRQTARP